MSQPVLHVVDMHTSGEPVRIVREGYPEIPGADILAKRRYAREHLDHLRRLLMFEPRGHYDMYGVIPVRPSLPEADLAVLFIHNEGYSTMCGHAVIALGRYAVDHGLVAAREPLTPVNIECPCGLVRAQVEVRDGRAGRVFFDSVPAFALALDASVEVPGCGVVLTDVAYGGAFYAILPAARLGLDLARDRLRDLVDGASAVTAAVRQQIPLQHPDAADLAFLYGTILTDGGDTDPSRPSRNVCVFADAQVDRSPTGSGVTARVALQHRRGLLPLAQAREFESLTGARFSGMPVAETRCGELPAVTVRVAGQAHYCGESRFWLEEDDVIGRGFLLR
ncbi:MAG TPA: proline racemase family protein [Candidatus Competibacteraceae bacterium]|nr:proline racemase family protein [Candidatus Competibacteraceae bacterium]